MRTRRAVVLVSGADSEVLVAEMLRRGWTVFPLYVRCGFVWEDAELVHLRRALRSLSRPRLKRLVVTSAPMKELMHGHWSLTGRGVPPRGSDDGSVYIPGRNMVLFLRAWLHAALHGCSLVAIGTLKANPFPDATAEFRAAARRALNIGMGVSIQVIAPYARLTKAEVLRHAGRFKLNLAFSCLRPRRGKACGRCSKCEELEMARRVAKL
jgi:7-cyano-7-deazaguanine synthase